MSIPYSVRERTLKQVSLPQIYELARVYLLSQPRTLIENRRGNPLDKDWLIKVYNHRANLVTRMERTTTRCDELFTIQEANIRLRNILNEAWDLYEDYLD